MEARRQGIKTSSDVSRQPRGEADLAGGRELAQALLFAFRQWEPVDESVQRVSCDAVSPAGKGLELLVGLLEAVTPHHGLDRFRQHLPRLLEVLAQARRACLDLRQAGSAAVPAEQRVPEGNAYVAQHGGVRQVALPA